MRKDHNVSETASVSVLRWMGEEKPTQLGPLGRASLNHWIETKISPIVLYNIHHRQNPFCSTAFTLQTAVAFLADSSTAGLASQRVKERLYAISSSCSFFKTNTSFPRESYNREHFFQMFTDNLKTWAHFYIYIIQDLRKLLNVFGNVKKGGEVNSSL
jgi:hypothetical protein